MDTASENVSPDDIAAAVAKVLSGPPETARAWLAQQAAAGVAEAQALLGQMLLDGAGGPADPAGALALFLRAAGAGHPMALNMVGRCYENGWGVAANLAVAAQWYLQAAEAGSDWGMYNLATRLMLGEGVEADRKSALAWFQRAAELGHAKSINVVGGFYEDGWEVEQDFAKARDCYARAAAGGDFRGHFNFGRVLAAEGEIAGAQAQFEQAATTATAAFTAKMVAFLRSAPVAAYRDLADRLDASGPAAG